MTTQKILLMTATVTPPQNAANLARTDPQARLQDYTQALKFYLSLIHQGIDKIIFAENSNSDLTSLEEIITQKKLKDRVELLVWYGLDYPPSYSRAYGEFKLIDYVMNNSQTIRNLQENHAIIWKITGRYKVKNLTEIITRQPKDFGLYINFRNLPRAWADMYLIAWSIKGYQSYLQEVYPQLKIEQKESSQGISPEELFRVLLKHKKIDEVKLVSRFNTIPIIDGIRGFDGQNYSEAYGKLYLRRLAIHLFPWLWI